MPQHFASYAGLCVSTVLLQLNVPNALADFSRHRLWLSNWQRGVSIQPPARQREHSARAVTLKPFFLSRNSKAASAPTPDGFAFIPHGDVFSDSVRVGLSNRSGVVVSPSSQPSDQRGTPQSD